MKIAEAVKKVVYGEGVNPLPTKVVSVLFALMLVHSMTTTMVYSYLPKLVKEFGISEINTGYYAGFVASALFLGNAIFSLIWGYIGDKKGQKTAALTSASGLMLATLAFAFSFNYDWVLCTRFIQGCFMGLAVICKSIVADLCDDTNMSLGIAIVLSAFSAGLLLGPSLGGFLAFPADQYPAVKGSLFEQFGILLPNTILVIGVAISIAFAIVILPPNKVIKECVLCSVLYGTNCLVEVGFDEMFPVYSATATQYNGLAFTTADIGTALLLVAGLSIIIEFTVFPRITKKYGPRKVFMMSMLIQAISIPTFPALAAITNKTLLWIVLVVVLLITRTAMASSLLTVNVLLNNSVTTELLGSANGLGLTCACLGRAFGPFLYGSTYTWSLGNIKVPEETFSGFPFNQYFIFFVISILAVLNAIFVAYSFKKSMDEKKIPLEEASIK